LTNRQYPKLQDAKCPHPPQPARRSPHPTRNPLASPKRPTPENGSTPHPQRGTTPNKVKKTQIPPRTRPKQHQEPESDEPDNGRFRPTSPTKPKTPGRRQEAAKPNRTTKITTPKAAKPPSATNATTLNHTQPRWVRNNRAEGVYTSNAPCEPRDHATHPRRVRNQPHRGGLGGRPPKYNATIAGPRSPRTQIDLDRGRGGS
jgi:hypothetical protein